MPMPNSEMDPDPNALESMRRMAFDRSKWLQTCTYVITKYEYNKEELHQFYSEFVDVIGRVRSKLTCPLCQTISKKTVTLPCGHFMCLKCSTRRFGNQRHKDCPTCKIDCDGQVMPLYCIDAIMEDMNSFTKEAKYFQNPKPINNNDSKEAAKRLRSMNFVMLQRLKNIEAQLMCDFCFNKLNRTYLVNCATDAFTRRPFCSGCDAKYMKFYEKEQGRQLQQPIQFSFFDEVVNEFYEFFTKLVEYSVTKKEPTRFMSSSENISMRPIYKLLAGAILVGIFLAYISY